MPEEEEDKVLNQLLRIKGKVQDLPEPYKEFLNLATISCMIALEHGFPVSKSELANFTHNAVIQLEAQTPEGI